MHSKYFWAILSQQLLLVIGYGINFSLFFFFFIRLFFNFLLYFFLFKLYFSFLIILLLLFITFYHFYYFYYFYYFYFYFKLLKSGEGSVLFERIRRVRWDASGLVVLTLFGRLSGEHGALGEVEWVILMNLNLFVQFGTVYFCQFSPKIEEINDIQQAGGHSTAPLVRFLHNLRKLLMLTILFLRRKSLALSCHQYLVW